MSEAEPLQAECENYFTRSLPSVRGVYVANEPQSSDDERHTSAAFAEKWDALQQDKPDSEEGWKTEQFHWYLECYGFEALSFLIFASSSSTLALVSARILRIFCTCTSLRPSFL